MAESEHDDLADALARMSDNDFAPSEPEPAAPLPPSPSPAMKPAMPARPVSSASPANPVAARPPAARAVAPRPAAPGAAASAERPSRPAAPTLASAAASPPGPIDTSSPPARPQRPVAPTLRPLEVGPTDFLPPADTGQSPGLEVPEIFDDEDAVIVPPPEPSAFIPKPKPTTTADFRAKAAARKSLDLRRTLIPILLTTGVLMFFFALIKFVLGPDSPLTALPIWVPLVFILIGSVLLGLAVINMLSVKAALEKAAAVK